MRAPRYIALLALVALVAGACADFPFRRLPGKPVWNEEKERTELHYVHEWTLGKYKLVVTSVDGAVISSEDIVKNHAHALVALRDLPMVRYRFAWVDDLISIPGTIELWLEDPETKLIVGILLLSCMAIGFIASMANALNRIRKKRRGRQTGNSRIQQPGEKHRDDK